jgi:hypothetical protein
VRSEFGQARRASVGDGQSALPSANTSFNSFISLSVYGVVFIHYTSSVCLSACGEEEEEESQSLLRCSIARLFLKMREIWIYRLIRLNSLSSE